MNQQEIFYNMTKGEWSADHTFIDILDERSEYDKTLFNCMGKYELDEKIENKANAAAAASAVQHTYGNSINPESVRKMKDVLEFVLKVFEADPTDKQYGRYDYEINKIKEVLISTKL